MLFYENSPELISLALHLVGWPEKRGLKKISEKFIMLQFITILMLHHCHTAQLYDV